MQKIIKVLCSSVLMAIFISSFARADTYVSGTVVADGQSGTWTKGSSPYIATGMIYVNGTLTIEPGVEVRFKTATAMIINGILIAEGTPDGTITFTSNQNPKNKGDWAGIIFNGTSKPSKLTYCQIEYGGKPNGNIYCTNCVQLPVIASCTISNSDNAGIYSIILSLSHPILYLQHCLIRDNDGYPVLTGPMLDMKDNTIINNGVEGSSGNVICICGVSSTGIIEDITWHNQGIPYLITNDNLLIGDLLSPGTLTIDAGVTIKVDKNRAIIIGDASYWISGCLQANGTDGGRITFTSNQIPVNPGDWGYIKFTGYSQNSYLKYCKIEYGGNDSTGPKPAIWCDSSAPEISNTDISNVYSHGVAIFNNSSPTITWTTIRAGTATYDNVGPSCIYSNSSCPQIGSSSLMKSKYGIYAKYSGIPSLNITNSNIIGNTSYGILNEGLGVGTITATNNWWGDPSGPAPQGSGDKVSEYVEYSPWIGIDTVSPDQITLELRGIGLGSVTLQWLPTGDDFDIGTPTYYVINYATTPITNNNWGKVFGSKTLSPDTLSFDGKYYYYSVENLSPKTLYYFGIKAVDDAGNWSDLSNCVGATTKAILETPQIYNVINGNTWIKLSIQNTDSNHQVGFWVYYGSRTGVSSENYDYYQDAGIVAECGSLTSSFSTETIISNLDNGKLYYFVAYAYDPASSTNKSKWSDKSNEVIGSPTALSFATITGSSNVLVGGSVTYTGQGYGSFGEKFGSLTYSWWFEPEPLGTLSSTNTSTVTFSAGTKTMRGTLTVEARDGTISVTAHLIITLFAGTPTTVWILDKQGVSVTKGTITAGGSLFFLGSGTDKYGNSVESFQYFWQTTAGTINPILGTSTTLTGTKATTGTLTLSADGTQTSISVTIFPTSTTKFIFEHILSPQRPGTPFDVTLNSADEFDNLTQDSHIAGTVTLTISNGTSSLGTMSVISGFGTKSICIDLPGSYTIYARGTFTQSPEIVLQGTSNSFLVEAGTPTQFIFLSPPGTISVSAAGTTTITAYLADNTGFRIGTAGVECNLSIWAKTPNATGTLGTLTTITDANGQISTTCQVGTTAGSQIKVLITTNSFNGISGTSSLIITKSGSVAKFEFSDIGTQTAGIPFWGTITANDNYGNLAEDFIGTVSLGVLALPPGTITPTQTGTFTNGQWTGTMTITTAFKMGFIIATHSSGAVGTSNLFTVIPAGLHHINLIPTYATTTIEGTISFSCNGEDVYGNKIDGLIYDWESIVGTFTPAQGTSTVFTAGTLATTGTIAVKSGTRTAIGTVTILAGTLSSLAISPSPATMTAGSTLTLTATGYDAYGNQLATISCVWETNIGTITYESPIAYLYATKTGTGMATVTANGIATSTTVTVNFASLHHFTYDPVATLTAGENIIFTVYAKDKWDNVVGDYGDANYLFISADGEITQLVWNATQSPTFTFTSGHLGPLTESGNTKSYDEVFLFTHQIADETRRGTSNIFAILPGPPNKFTIALGTNSVAVGATTSVTVQLTDQYGNPVEVQGTTAELSVIGTGTLDRTVGTTNTDGKIEAIWTASTEVGTESFIQVVSVYGTSTSATITTKIGTLSYITLSTQTINLQVDATCTITATGYDEFGHEIMGLIFDWATTLGTLTSIIGSTTTFEARTLAGKGTLTVKYDNVATQTSININPGTITHFSFEPIANQIRDEIFYATVTARDKYENLISDYATETNLYDAKNGTLTTINLNQGIGAGSISLGTEFLGMTYILSQANDIRGTSNDFFVLIDDAQGGTVTKIFAQGTTTIAFKNGVFQGIDYYPDINPATSSVMIDTANNNLDPTLEQVPSSIREIKVFSGTPTLLQQTFETDTVTLSLSYLERVGYPGYVETGTWAVFEQSLKIYRLDEGNSQWVLIPGTVNTELNIVTASIPHLPATYILIGNIPTLDHFAFSIHPPAIAYAGGGFSIGIEARDKNGNRLGDGLIPSPPYNGTASLGLNIPGTITPDVITFNNGYFDDNASITTAGANISIIVQSDEKIGTSSLFTVSPQLYTHFEFDYIGTMNVGIPGTITIFAKDEFGNNDDINHPPITVSLEVPDNLIIPSQVTIPQGTGTWCGTVTIYNNQINARIIANDGFPNPNVGTSNPFNIIGGELASIIIEPATSTIAQLGTASFMAKGYTSSHFEILPEAGYTWTVSSNLLGSFTFMAEKGTFTIFQAGTKAMTGTIAVTSGSITAIVTITVNPGSVTSLLISPHGATTTSNSEVKYEVTAVDSYGNTWTVTAQTQFVTNDPAGTMTAGKEIYTAGKVGT
ncbi:MAG: hypothetical protein AB1414_12975, partial [bacterium]